MEHDLTMRRYILQPNEVFECGLLRVTNLGTRPASITEELARAVDLDALTAGPRIGESNLEFRLRLPRVGG